MNVFSVSLTFLILSNTGLRYEQTAVLCPVIIHVSEGKMLVILILTLFYLFSFKGSEKQFFLNVNLTVRHSVYHSFKLIIFNCGWIVWILLFQICICEIYL